MSINNNNETKNMTETNESYEDLLYSALYGECEFPEVFDDYYDEPEEICKPEEIDETEENIQEIEEDFRNGEFIFAKDVKRSLDDRITRLNNNVLVVGASGCGKSTSFVEPNLITAKGNYVVSDPKGTLYKKYSEYLKNKGYQVLKIDFQHPENSSHWNPLTEVKSTQDIMKMANSVVYDKEEKNHRSDPFWDRTASLLICAIIGYMYETNYKPYNFSSILQLVREGERKTSNHNSSELAERFRKLHLKNPDSWAYKQFKSVNQAPEKTYDTILTTLVSKFANYNTEEIEKMMSGNDFNFSDIAHKKTALFVIQSDCDRSMDGLVNMFFAQAINAFIKCADTYENGRLPIPVRFFLDDYGATTNIYNLDEIISTIRSRNISVSIILQSESQLMTNERGTDTTIISNCDTYIYMGSNDVYTARAVSYRCNKPLEKILYMPVNHCWIFSRGQKPIYTEMSERPDLSY
ncbi:MAG: type IV secretory system conjugative DNA transfer family protein [Ruminococcus sp.]|nr:type IV secretory system conjugative DNA transfer family protein [Ruminococcus sp.]